MRREYLLALTVVLLVSAVALAGGVTMQMSRSTSLENLNLSPDIDDIAFGETEAGLSSRGLGTASTYNVVGNNDLFRPERKPYHTPTPQPTEKVVGTPTPEGTPLPPPKGLKLSGILRLNRKRVALISESTIDSGQPMAYGRGDALLAYTVDHIGSTQAILKDENGEKLVLKLRDYDNMLASSAPPQVNQQNNPAPRVQSPRRANQNQFIDQSKQHRSKNVNKLLQMMQEGARRQNEARDGDFDDFGDGFEDDGGFENDGFGGGGTAGSGMPDAPTYGGDDVGADDGQANPFLEMIRQRQAEQGDGADINQEDVPEIFRILSGQSDDGDDDQ